MFILYVNVNWLYNQIRINNVTPANQQTKQSNTMFWLKLLVVFTVTFEICCRRIVLKSVYVEIRAHWFLDI